MISVGMIGAGSVLWAYLRVAEDLVARGLVDDIAVHVRSETTRSRVRGMRPAIHLVGDIDEILADDFDVVVVLTPPHTHAEIVTLSLGHGKHVLCEKPLALDQVRGMELLEAARSGGLHLMSAPFVHLSPSLRQLWTIHSSGRLGNVHSARGLYGNSGAPWAEWMHTTGVGPLAELGIYNIKSLTSLLGPVVEVYAAETTSDIPRHVRGERLVSAETDVSHLVMRHEEGTISSVVASQAIHRYRRPGLELYGSQGTANLLGDDWDPTGIEVWSVETGRWETFEPADTTWSWADGLRELVLALHEQRDPLSSPAQDLHILEVLDAARASAGQNRAVMVMSRFAPLDLEVDLTSPPAHDHTRPIDMQ